MQRARFDSRFAKLLRRAGGGSEALDGIALGFDSLTDHRERGRLSRASNSLNALNPVRRVEHILDYPALRMVQVRMLCRKRDRLPLRQNGRKLVFTRAHPAYDLLFFADGSGRGELPGR